MEVDAALALNDAMTSTAAAAALGTSGADGRFR